jgi:hypothetical protein
VPIAFRDFILGYLIFRSGYFPKTIGLLLALAGPCFLADSFVDFLAPSHPLPDAILLFTGIAELSLCLWLIVKGVNVAKWRAAVSAARARAG